MSEIGAALVESIATKFKAEGQAVSLGPPAPGFALLRYHQAREWPGPPRFNFSLELLTGGGTLPRSLTDRVRALPQDALVTRTYHSEAECDPTHYWFMPVLEKDLDSPQGLSKGLAEGSLKGLKEATSTADIELINRTHEGENAVKPDILNDNRIKSYFLTQGEQAVASGCLVITGRKIAYICDMFTAPRFRGRGFGKTVLRGLLDRAAQAGCERAVLLASPFAQKAKFYERAGFAPAGGFEVAYFLPLDLAALLSENRSSI